MTEAAQKTFRLSDAFARAALLNAVTSNYLTEENIHRQDGKRSVVFDKETALDIILLGALSLNDGTTLAPEPADWETLDQIGIIKITYKQEAPEGAHYGIRFLENVPDFELALIDESEEKDASPPFYAQITLLEPNHP